MLNDNKKKALKCLTVEDLNMFFITHSIVTESEKIKFLTELFKEDKIYTYNNLLTIFEKGIWRSLYLNTEDGVDAFSLYLKHLEKR